MFEKNMRFAYLVDFYGELLSDSRREAARLYYNEDLSLAEIAEITGITRQGVRDSIAKARMQLLSYEEKLGLAGKFRSIESTLQDIIPRLERISEAACDAKTRAELHDIIEKTQTITI